MNLLSSLKETGKNLGAEMGLAWESLSEGWHELLSRSGAALTHFKRVKEENPREDGLRKPFPRWGLVAGELEETPNEFLVRIELPGLDKEDCDITLEGNMLRVRGEKRLVKQSTDSTYHVMERAYGAFQRQITLPRSVATEKAEAMISNGVLTVRLPKNPAAEKAHQIQIS